MAIKFKKWVDGYNESQGLLEALQKDKETWEEKLVNMKAKVIEITAKEKILQDSLDIALFSKKNLEREVSELTGELVSTYAMYFERAKEQVSFFYPILDLRKLDFLKFFYDSQLVDEETVAPSEPKGYASSQQSQGGDMEMEMCESKAPQPQGSLKKEAIMEMD